MHKVGLYHDKRKPNPWVVRWLGEYDPATDKQKRYSRSFKLRRHAEAFRTEQTDKFRNGLQRDRPVDVTLKKFGQDWLKTKKPEVRAASLRDYKDTMQRLYDYFGKSQSLSKITPYMAAGFIANLKPIRITDKLQSLSNWTRKKILRNCHIIFKAAVTWHVIDRDPFENVKSPKVVTTKWHYLNPVQYRALLDAAPTLRCKTLYALAYTAGLRRGEAFSLTWDDIDFVTGEVTIENHPASETLPPFYIKGHEARKVPLPKHTLDILTELRAEAEGEVPYVLHDKARYEIIVAKWQTLQKQRKEWENRFMTNNTDTNFKRHIGWIGIEPKGTLSLHTLRKCCGKNWADNLPANVTKELMGHSKIETTMKYYNQVDKYQRIRAAEVINNLVSEIDPRRRSDVA